MQNVWGEMDRDKWDIQFNQESFSVFTWSGKIKLYAFTLVFTRDNLIFIESFPFIYKVLKVGQPQNVFFAIDLRKCKQKF